MEHAPARVVAAVLSQPVGHRPEQPDYMYNSGKDVWAKEFRERRPDVSMATIEAYLHSLYRAAICGNYHPCGNIRPRGNSARCANCSHGTRRT
jgi:hypothetical protein